MLLAIIIGMVIEPVKLQIAKDIYKQKPIKLVQITPEASSNPTDSTLVYMGYTKDKLVFYFKNYQQGAISATTRKRDAESLKSEDNIVLILATHGKGHNAYYIIVNPLGSVYDKMLTQDGSEVEWDGDIKAWAHKTDYGWECMINIPFSTINYSKGTWGIQVERNIVSTMGTQGLYITNHIGSPYEVADMNIDFNYISKGHKNTSMSILPVLRFERVYNSKENKWTDRIRTGGTFRFKQKTHTVMDITAYPDYSELPLDFKEFSVNRLPIEYPEKRPFFIEGRAYYTPLYSLIRTRNIEDIKYGGKFYTAGKGADFGAYYIKDTTLGDIVSSNFTYHVSSLTDIGVFTAIDTVNYNVFAINASHSIKKYGASFGGQLTKVLNNNAYYKSFYINKNAETGLSGGFSYQDIDKGFISPLNTVSFSFDGVRWYGFNFDYRRYFKAKNKDIFVRISSGGEYVHNKIDRSLVLKDIAPQIEVNMLPYVIVLATSAGNFNYLHLNDNTTITGGVALGYYLSSWKKIILILDYGNYLGGHIFNPSLTLNISPFGLNTGIETYFVKSPLDSLYALNFYGEYPTPVKHLLIKPSIIYTNNFLENAKDIDMNIVFLYEPDYLRGVYLAYQRSLHKEDKNPWSLLNGKIIFKIKWGFKVF